LPVNPESGETGTDTLDGRETDNWSTVIITPICQERFDHLVEFRAEAENNSQQER
jgi:hypothetical protein